MAVFCEIAGNTRFYVIKGIINFKFPRYDQPNASQAFFL